MANNDAVNRVIYTSRPVEEWWLALGSTNHKTAYRYTHVICYDLSHQIQKRVKAAENESKLKQVYIPSYNKPNPNLLSGKLSEDMMGGRPCEGCATEKADAWYAWGPMQLSCRLCKYALNIVVEVNATRMNNSVSSMVPIYAIFS